MRNVMMMVVLAMVMLVMVGCGNQSGTQSIKPSVAATTNVYTVTITVGGGKLRPVDVDADVAVMKADGMTVMSIDGNTVVASTTDESLNKYIEEGRWVRIHGDNVDAKRSID